LKFFEYFNSTDWGLAYRMLTGGDVPLILQLLILNTIFLVIYIARNATAKFRMRQSTVLIIQGILIGANLAVVLQDQLLPVVHKYTIF
jgi:hypothetical protein